MKDEKFVGHLFHGFSQNPSSGETPLSTSKRNQNALTSYESIQRQNHGALTHDNDGTAISERKSSLEKKGRASRYIGGGMRQYANTVCKKLASKGRTTYSQVADEIMAEFARMQSNSSAALDKSDEKNIPRRVYDVLNVLLALDIIAKNKKEIEWKGFPDPKVNNLEEIKVLREKLMNRIPKKVAYLKDLEEQIVGKRKLIERNQQLTKCRNAPSVGISLPFILIQTSPNAIVDIEISEDKKMVHVDFNSTPFSLHDDSYVVKLMCHHQQPGSRMLPKILQFGRLHDLASHSAPAERGL